MLSVIAMAVAMPALSSAPSTSPLVIAHRGASGYRPEHTLAAYDLAIDQGADFIEPDLVKTKDGVLICRHDNELTDSTDVADRPEFASRKTSKVVDGERLEGWFTEDFTLSEIKSLRTRERLPKLRPDSAAYDGQFEIPTLQEVIELARKRSRSTGRTIGLYPETKHPSYFRSIGLPFEEGLARKLHAFGWVDARAPVFIQSFEVDNLRLLKRLTGVRLIQLVMGSSGPFDKRGQTTYAEMLTDRGLKDIASYAWGIGAEKTLVVPRNADGTRAEPSDLVARSGRAGLAVHVWTHRKEPNFLPKDLGNDPIGEAQQFYELGVQGIFSDHPDLAFEARKRAKLPSAINRRAGL